MTDTPEQTVEHTAGDLAVVEIYSGRWVVEQITRVTPLMVFVQRSCRKGESRYDKSAVAFSGPEPEAKALAEVLTSLESRRKEAARGLYEQHKARVQAAILRATGAQ